MTEIKRDILKEEALKVMEAASAGYGIKASAISRDNYNRVWSRDSVVTGLAILSNDCQSLYPSFLESLKVLRQAAAPNGQIPSNVSVDEHGQVNAVSFGGPVGRTDCSFWWVIGAINYLRKNDDPVFHREARDQTELIMKLAESWEFNYRGLMHLPVSSNWADEFITGGYVLYDQLLRYWALLLAGRYFGQEKWVEQAARIKTAIKVHYCFESELNQSLFTTYQQEKVKTFSLQHNFICSFNATQVLDKYDSWSAALLILLDIPSESGMTQLVDSIMREFSVTGIGLPAFWPVIEESDSLYEQLRSNHSYRFKNRPGHFHNGGIWPVTNSFLITALAGTGRTSEARQISGGLFSALEDSLAETAFPEYFDKYEHRPLGVTSLCYSAAGYLLAARALDEPDAVYAVLGLEGRRQARIAEANARKTADAIIQSWHISGDKPLAISIAGESGCGKTTLGQAMDQLLTSMGYSILLLHQDDYFRLPPKQNHAQRLADFSQIGIDEVDLDLLNNQIKQVKEREATSLVIPVMNWITDTREFRTVDVSDVDIILVDGTYTTLLNDVDVKVFMTATYKETKMARIGRNRETITDFIEKVLEKEHGIISSHRDKADLLVLPDGAVLKRMETDLL